MLKDNGSGNYKSGQSDADEINYKFNTLKMEEFESHVAKNASIIKKDSNTKILLSTNDKIKNEINMDLIFDKMMTNLKINSHESDIINDSIKKEKLSKMGFNAFKNNDEKYYIKELRLLKDNENKDQEHYDKNKFIQINHNVCTGFTPMTLKNKAENRVNNLFSTISRVNTNDNWAFKSSNNSNSITHLSEIEGDSDEYCDQNKTLKESPFHKSYTHKKRKISKELQLHQEYAKKNLTSDEIYCDNKQKPLSDSNPVINSNFLIKGDKPAEGNDLRGVRNIKVKKKQTVFKNINFNKNQEILIKLKEKLKKIGINYRQENYHSNYLILFEIPSASINNRYELLIQHGNNKILEYKKTNGKEIIVSVLNTEESNEKIILKELTSLDKDLDLEYSVNKKKCFD